MIIAVQRDSPHVTINGLPIETAPPIGQLLRAIGTPTRTDAGPRPAPVGHRNNQLHVFDPLGLHVSEHHYTRRAQAIGIALDVTEPRFRFTPASPYTGELWLDGKRMPLRATESQFLQAASWQFKNVFAGEWSCTFEGFYVGFTAIAPKLPTGRRGRQRTVVAVSISWPHDPRGEPA